MKLNPIRRRLLMAGATVLLPQGAQSAPTLRVFERDSLKHIDTGPRPYVLTFWGLNCAACVHVLHELARWQDTLRIITVALDSMNERDELLKVLAHAGLTREAWVFGNAAPEALRHAIDPSWAGEKPRSYLVARDGSRRAVSGLLKSLPKQLVEPASHGLQH